METIKIVGLTVLGVGLFLGLVKAMVPVASSNFTYKVGQQICLKSTADEFKTFNVNVLASFKYKENNSYVIEVVDFESVQLADEVIMDKFVTTCK